MPGPALHHIIADRLKAEIFRNGGLGNVNVDYSKLQQLLNDPKNLPYLFLGSQGPDFMFFNTKDMNQNLGKFVKTYFEVYDFIENFKEKLLGCVPQPVLDALVAFDESIDTIITNSALLSELQQTFNDISRMLDAFAATLIEMLKKFVTQLNIFDDHILTHPYRDGVKPDEKWWWFDAMHYRKTGKFAKQLLDATGNNLSSPLHLYALGYLTHCTADIVGHPYVNLIAGGSYRSHSQRHKTGESYQDVFNLLQNRGIDFNHSAFHWLYNFNYNNQPIQPIEQFKNARDHPDLNTNLPKDLAKLIANTINSIYQEDSDPDPEYGAKVTPDDINNAYRLYYKWFKGATDTGTLPNPVAYSFSAELREVFDKTMNNLGKTGDFLKNAVDHAGDWGILSIFIILAALIAAAVMGAAAIADGIAGAIATTGTSTIRAAACLIYEQLFNAYQNFRLGVSLNGLAFPMKEHLTDPRLLQFANPSNNDPTGINANNIKSLLPFMKYQPNNIINTILHKERHLIYPTTNSELAAVKAALDSYTDKTSTHYAFGDIPFSPLDILDQLENIIINSNTNDSAELARILRQNGSLGNAGLLAEKLYERWKSNKSILDFNLDADRGYAYPCWNQVQNGVENKSDFPQKLETKNPIDLHFIK